MSNESIDLESRIKKVMMMVLRHSARTKYSLLLEVIVAVGVE
jgi:hypothetical protein